MCFSVQHFVECYQIPEESCTAKIYTDFADLMKILGSLLFIIDEHSPGVMPGC